MNHKKVLLRKIYFRRLRLKEDRLKRLNPKFFRLRKARWTFRKKSLKKYLYIHSKFKYDDKIYAEDLRYYLSDEFYFYDLYRFYADIAYGDEVEFGQELNLYTKPTTLYSENDYFSSENKPEKLTEFKTNLAQLANKLSSKRCKNALVVNNARNGKFKFTIIKNKQFSIEKKEKQNEIAVQSKISGKKFTNEKTKKGTQQTNKKPVVHKEEKIKNVQKVDKNVSVETKKSAKNIKKVIV